MSADSRWHKAAPIPLAVRVTWGTALLVAPGQILRLMGGADEGRGPRRVMRILGARHLAEAAAERRFGGTAREIGVGVDLIHAASDVGFAWLNARWRRAALTDAAVTAGFAVLGVVNA